MNQVAQWTPFEITLQCRHEYENPFWDVTVRFHFTAPSGRQQAVDAFWDGRDIWRVRVCPDEVGEWSWWSESSDTGKIGLCGRRGRFECVPYEGTDPLAFHGSLRLSPDRHHFVHDDGQPFFWLADTAWNGAMRAREEDWRSYLTTRRRQGFTAIQFVTTQWRGLSMDPIGETAFKGERRIQINPSFFQRLDPKVAAINEHGLVCAPVLLWTLTEADPGQLLPEADAIRIARYMVARWGAYHVVWLLGGDGRYQGDRAERWCRIGRGVFDDPDRRLVTMHPCGQSWVGREFRGEPWFDFIGYQSGHGDSDEHLRWLVQGPVIANWRNEPAKPVINLEPNYEGHPSYHGGKPFGAYEVRRAAYWSLLITPPAGVTFGHNSIWVWPEKSEAAEGHPNIGPVAPWHTGLETAGTHSMSLLRGLFHDLPWWRLRPGPELLAEQPGDASPDRFIAVARTDEVLVAYTPRQAEIRLQLDSFRLPAAARWFNPRDGEWRDATSATTAKAVYVAPDDSDWLLIIGGF